MEKKLFLLDAYALIYRAYYALIKSPRITSYGFNTSAIFGFCNTLEEVLKKEKPSHIAVCFDPKGPTFRHEAFAEYKANREKQPEDISAAVPYIKDILKAKGIPCIEIEGYEADDVIGTLSKKAEREGFITYMMTPDKDYGQLVTEKTLIYKPSLRGQDFEIRGVEQIKEKYGIETPLQVIDLLALEGDTIDNIPGCPGVGPKTAQKLIQEYTSVENLIENVEQLKGALKEKIINNSRQIIFSKFLTTINTDVPNNIEIEQLKAGTPDTKALIEIFDKLEFRTFINRIGSKGSAQTTEKTAVSTPLPQQEEFNLFNLPEPQEDLTKSFKPNIEAVGYDSLEALLDQIKKEKRISLIVKSVGENDMKARPVAVALTITAGSCHYLSFPSPIDTYANDKVNSFFSSLFACEGLLIITANVKRCAVMFRHITSKFKCSFFDLELASYLIDPEAKHLLPEIAYRFLGYKTQEYDVEPRNRKLYELNDTTTLADILAEQSDVTLALYDPLKQELDKYHLWQLYQNVELPLAFVLARMEINGVRIDIPELHKLSKAYTERLTDLENKAYEMAGTRFNISSPTQVGEILFERLTIDPKAKKTKRGSYSTTEEILEKYKSRHPIVDTILQIRQLKKLLTTYIDALPSLVDPSTGKIHTTFNQTVTSTGRLSSTTPNLQNIPVRGDDGREIRKAFIADEGCIFMSADYSQIELRLMADFSHDPHMLDAFSNGIDIHQDTASRIYHKTLEEVTADERRNAKTANFGIIYGISPFGLSERLGIARSEAKELIDNYMQTYPAVKEYIANIIGAAKEQGFVSTFTGRRRYLKEINSGNSVVRGYGERNAVNAPLQGSAADIIKIAMVNIQKELDSKQLHSQMNMQVHDELIFNVLAGELPLVMEIVTREMENAYQGKVRMEVSAGTGRNWLEAH